MSDVKGEGQEPMKEQRAPTIGRILHYRLTSEDAARRESLSRFRSSALSMSFPIWMASLVYSFVWSITHPTARRARSQ